MAALAEKLTQLEDRMAQKAMLRYKLNRLRSELNALEESCQKVQFSIQKAQEAAAELEKFSTKTVWYRISGKLQEKREEKQRAVRQYEQEREKLCMQKEEIQQQLRTLGQQQMELADCERKYTAMVESGRRKLLETPGAARDEYTALCDEMTAQETRRKELKEAIQAAARAGATAETLLDSLRSAKGWSTWDATGGGGLTTDYIKYRKIDDAQSIAGTLSHQLSALRSELSDLDNTEELSIRVEGFVRFADWFFDDFISAWCVRSQICDSIDQAEKVKDRLEQLKKRLQGAFEDSEQRTRTLQRECEDVLRKFISQQESVD